jgi:hypothetical protein
MAPTLGKKKTMNWTFPKLTPQQCGAKEATLFLENKLINWTREEWIEAGKSRAAGIYFSQEKRDLFLQSWMEVGNERFPQS